MSVRKPSWVARAGNAYGVSVVTLSLSEEEAETLRSVMEAFNVCAVEPARGVSMSLSGPVDLP